MLLYKSIGKSAFSGNLQPFQDFLTTQTGISALLWMGNGPGYPSHACQAIYRIGSLFVVTSEHLVKELLLVPI